MNSHENLTAPKHDWKKIVVYAILILASKKRVALKAALSICQIGEFALAIFAILISRKMNGTLLQQQKITRNLFQHSINL